MDPQYAHAYSSLANNYINQDDGFLNTDGRLDGLRSDPRFDELRRKIGLPKIASK